MLTKSGRNPLPGENVRSGRAAVMIEVSPLVDRSGSYYCDQRRSNTGLSGIGLLFFFVGPNLRPNTFTIANTL